VAKIGTELLPKILAASEMYLPSEVSAVGREVGLSCTWILGVSHQEKLHEVAREHSTQFH